VKAKLQHVVAYAGRDQFEMRNKTVGKAKWLEGPDGHAVFFGGFTR
jgi:hypothetical protein